MSLNKIVLEALAKNPIGLKESLSEILSEKIAIALEAKIEKVSEAASEGKQIGAAISRYEASRQRSLKKAASMVKKGFSHEDAARNHDVTVAELKKHLSESVEELDELSNKTLGNYIHKATMSKAKIEKNRDDNREQRSKVSFHDHDLRKAIGDGPEADEILKTRQAADDATRAHLDKQDKKLYNKAWNRDRGVYTAIKKLGK